jgi:ubiquinone/menaquinone biosynthesis C-methylase UbiE
MKKRILNVGCGTDTYGTDFTDKYPQRPEVKKCDQDKDKLPYPTNTFDEVIFTCVLEHLRNQGFALKEIHRVIKPNGKLYLLTDNANYWGWAVGKTHLGGYDDAHIFGDENKHMALFTSQHLINQTKAVGFRKIRVKYELITAGKKLQNIKEYGFRYFIPLLVKTILDRTPFWRMGSSRLEVTARK